MSIKSNYQKPLGILILAAFLAVGVANTAMATNLDTLAANATWGTADGSGGYDGTNTAGDAITIATFTLTFDGADTTTTGALTGSTGTIAINGTNANTLTIGSIALSGAGNITSTIADNTNAVATTITGNLSTTSGNLTITNNEATNANALSMSVGGTLSVGGTTGVTAGSQAGAATAALTVTGNSTFTGALTVTGGTSNAAADATVTLNGGTIALTAGATLDDNTGQAILIFNGTGAQGITGTINGNNASAGEGTITNTNSAGTVTFNSDIGVTNSVNTINLNSTATTAFSGAVSATTINFGANGTATVADAKNVTAAITVTNTNNGTLTFLGTTTMTGDVGASGLILNTINANGASGKTVAFTGDVYATTFNFGDDGTVTIADTKGLTAAVTTSTNNTGTLTFSGTSTMTGNVGATTTGLLKAVNINGSGKTVTLTGNLYATATTIANLATLKFTNSTTAVEGTLTTSGTTGTIDIGTATVTTAGAVNLGASSKLALTIGSTNGRLIATTTGLTVASGVTIVPTVSGTLTAGDITIIQNNDTDVGQGANDVSGFTITDNNASFNFSLKFTGNNIVLTVISDGSSSFSGNASAINDVTTTAFAGDSTLSTALNGLAGSEKEAALNTLAPVVSGGAVVGAVSAGGATASSVSARVASLRTGISAGQGLNAGDGISEDKHFWFQGFGTYADQGTRQGVTGFTSVTGGAALGADKQVTSKFLLGMAGSFAYSDVNTSLSQNRTTVKSYQTTFYGSYEFGNYYIDAQLGGAYNDYVGERFIAVGSVERVALSDYDGYQVMGKLEIGREMNFRNGVSFTPSIGASMIHVGIPEYSETGAGASNLDVKGQDYDILNATVRGELRRTYEFNSGNLTPQVNLGYNYEALDNPIQNISSFSGGGNTFQTTGFDPENHSVLGGLGVTYESAGNFDLVATYDLVTKTDYKSHSFLLKGRWDF